MKKRAPHSFFSTNAHILRVTELQIKAHSEVHLSEDGVMESIHGTVYSLSVAESPRAMNSAYFRCKAFLQASACNTDTTPTQLHRNSNTHRTKNNTTNVVIQQNSRKLLMMAILMSETCSTHKKWNKIASDIKLVFYSSTITMMHGPINVIILVTFANWYPF